MSDYLLWFHDKLNWLKKLCELLLSICVQQPHEKFDDIKKVIRNRKSNDRKYNGQKTNDKRTNNDLQNTTQKKLRLSNTNYT